MNGYRIRLSRKVNSAIRYGRFMIQNYSMMFFIRYLQQGKTYKKGKVTIVTPTYNRLEKLKDAIDSVRNQTYPLWEQIVVSDGHDERVQHLIAQFGDPRIRYEYTLKLNVMGNYQRNYALRNATGEYVLYLDDDNIIDNNCLATMTSGFTSDDIGYVICPIRYGNIIKNPRPGFRYREIDLLNYMVRRKLVERVWGQRVHAISDYLMIDAIRKLSRGVYLEEFIGHHR